MALSVADIMDTEAPTLRPEDDVETAVRLFKEHDVGGLPVVKDGVRCVGIVTEADLVIADEQGDLHIPHYIELFGGVVFLEPLRRFEERLKKAVGSSVRDIMTADPITVGPDASVHEAGRIIASRGHNRLPVVEHGRLVGVVTRVDVLEALTREE
jgi:CBS domain-containing protein